MPAEKILENTLEPVKTIRIVVWLILFACQFFSTLSIAQGQEAPPIRVNSQKLSAQGETDEWGELRTYQFDFPVAQFQLDTIGELLFVQEGKIGRSGQRPTRKIHYYNAKSGELMWSRMDLECKKTEKRILVGLPYIFCFEQAIAFDPMTGEQLWKLGHDRIWIHPNGKLIIGVDRATSQSVYAYDAATGKLIWKQAGIIWDLPREYRNTAFEDNLLDEELHAFGDTVLILKDLGFTYINLNNGNVWKSPTTWRQIADNSILNAEDKSRGYPSSNEHESPWKYHYHPDYHVFGSVVKNFDGEIYKWTNSYFMKFNSLGDTLWMTPTHSSHSLPVYIDIWNGNLLIVEYIVNFNHVLLDVQTSVQTLITTVDPHTGAVISQVELDLESGAVDFLLEESDLLLLTRREIARYSLTKGMLLNKNELISEKSLNLFLKELVSTESYLIFDTTLSRIRELHPNYHLVLANSPRYLLLNEAYDIVDFISDKNLYAINGIYKDFELVLSADKGFIIDTTSLKRGDKLFSPNAFMEGSYVYDTPEPNKIEIFQFSIPE